MKKIFNIIKATVLIFILLVTTQCAENKLEETPADENYPFRLILDADEGGDLADTEDYDLEVTFADFIGELPEETVTVNYSITNLTDDMIDAVSIDEIVYEDEDGDEHSLDFTASVDGLTGTITLNDPDTGTIPESFEIVFTLPGVEETFFAAGSFTFSLSNLVAGGANMILGTPYEFDYEVLDHELAGSWKYEIETEEQLNAFKDVFASLSPELETLEFVDILNGTSLEVEAEFEFEELNLKLAYSDTNNEEVEIEIEGDYDFEEGELEVEGSHLIIGDDGEIEDELDYSIEAAYEIDELNSLLTLQLFVILDEDHFKQGDELFFSEAGALFTFEKD
ncbi:MAG: hypothetical protein L0Y35_06175 [Flammeovirgaceae bacterium]|nr:hypothetical protein [Flammeovirgaceae bacterium]